MNFFKTPLLKFPKLLVLLIFLLSDFGVQHTLFAQTPSFLISGGSKLSDMFYRSCTDQNGNIYSSGIFQDTLFMGNSFVVSSGGSDAFFCKHNAQGNLLWLKKFGGSGYDYAGGLNIHQGAFLYLTGAFNGTVNFGPSTYSSSGNTDDVYLAKIDASNGNCIWVKKGGSPSLPDRMATVQFAGNNTMYLGVNIGPSGTFAGLGGLSSNGGLESYVFKMDTSGNILKYLSMGGTSNDYINSVALDANENVYVGGEFFSNTYFVSTYSSPKIGGYDIVVVKLDSALNLKWAKTGGGPSDDSGIDIKVDASGNTYLGGHCIKYLKIDSVTINTNANSRDCYIIKLDSSGNRVWAKVFGSRMLDIWSTGIVFTNQNQVFISGGFSDTLYYNSLSVISKGGFDGFLAEINPQTGNPISLQGFGTKGNDEPNNLLLNFSQSQLITSGAIGDTSIFGSTVYNYRGGTSDCATWIFDLQNIYTNNSLPEKICLDSSWSLNVPFTKNFSNANLTGYNVVLSDINGNFSNGTIIGTTNNVNANSIQAIIPSNTPFGSNYRIRVEGIGINGGWVNNGKNISIYQQPKSNFTVNKASQCYAGNVFTFTNTSIGNSGPVISYKWDFGDGTTSTLNAPVKSYASVAGYPVKLTTVSVCTDSVTKMIYVNPQPIAAFTSNSNGQCLKTNNFSYTNTSTLATGSMSYAWVFGDNTTSTATSPNKTYSTQGTYLVTLIAISDSNCYDTVSHQYMVYPAPAVSISTSNTSFCSGQSLSLQSTATGITTYEWYKNNSVISNSNTSNYTVNSGGNYSLKVTDTNGCDSTTGLVQIIEKPLPVKPVISQSADTLYSTLAPNYQWFYNSNLINGAAASFYRFSQNGVYTVQTDSNGCSNTSAPFTANLPTGISSLSNYQISVFPNPSKGKITVNSIDEITSIQLYNVTGVLVYDKQLENKTADLSLELKSGIYFLHVFTNDGTTIKKIVID